MAKYEGTTMRFDVWRQDNGEKRAIVAADAEEAAREFAERECEEDCDYYSEYVGDGGVEGSVDICVEDDDGRIHGFSVSGEQTVTFHVSPRDLPSRDESCNVVVPTLLLRQWARTKREAGAPIPAVYTEEGERARIALLKRADRLEDELLEALKEAGL